MKQVLNVRWLALVLALALALAACATPDPDAGSTTTAISGGDTTSTTEAPTTETTSGETTTPPTEPEGRTTLNVVIPTDPVALNPYPETAGNRAVVLMAMFLPLIQVDNEQNIYSDILDSWEVSDDATTITLTVADGLQWSDGTPITSADVALSLRHHLDTRISTLGGRLAGVAGVTEYTEGNADSISGIETPDDSTVVITLENPDAAWLPNWASLTRLNSMFPAHILGDVPPEDIPTHEYFETFPVVSGAYKFVEYVPDQYVELEANENFSLGTPGFEQVFFKIITEAEARLAQLQTGEIQYVDGVGAADIERLEAIEGITVETAEGLNPNVIGFNDQSPAFEDPRVKQALVLAIDREGLCEQVFLGYCSVSDVNVRLVGDQVAWAVPTVEDGMIDYSFDPDRARQLLDEAGWDESTTLNLWLMSQAAPEPVIQAINIMQAQWADVGVNVEITNVDVPTLLDNLGGVELNTDVHMFWNAGAVFTLDPSSVQPYNQCATVYPNGPNLTHYCDESTDGLWAEARLSADQAERAPLYHEIFLAENKNPNNLHFAVLDNIVAYDSRLQGVKVQGDHWQTYWNIGEWTWEE
ncbi:MAG TPA: ABC transporter substrate-binding protein [Acidimicrobiia bacterium]|nr:ABC transporter substrate-binding protein [Acidimicrobiia bacterium]